MKHLFNIILLLVLFLAPFTANVEAHKLQPAYLEINEQGFGTLNVLWKRPLVGNKPMNIYPQLPSSCTNITDPVVQALASGAVERWMVDCGSSNINETIIIDGLGGTGTGLCDWFTGSVLVYPEDGVVLVKEDKYKYEIRISKYETI